MELQEKYPRWIEQTTLIPVFVGMFPELRQSFPSPALPLFDQGTVNVKDLRDSTYVHSPLIHGLRAWGQSHLRPLRNWCISPERHNLLQRGGQIVFCGLVQPSSHVLSGVMLGSQLTVDTSTLQALAHTPWHVKPNALRHAIRNVLGLLQYQLLEAISQPKASDWACAYALVNVMQRMIVLSLLRRRTTSLFVNQYGKQKHLDPYDAVGYNNNVFIDFGSTRGPDSLYPRTVDLMLNNKRPLTLRFLQPGQSVKSYLAYGSYDSFWANCESQAEQALELQAHLGPGR